jgi:tocopherol cyclase
MIINKINALWHPECYHGWGKSKRFFEGWYYKVVSENQRHAVAIIPGIAMDENGKK